MESLPHAIPVQQFLIHSHFVCWQDSAALDCVAIILAFFIIETQVRYVYIHVLSLHIND